eukprot:1576186-Rhodomonas_salina.1
MLSPLNVPIFRVGCTMDAQGFDRTYDAGGLQLPTPFTVAFKEVGSHIQRCLNYPDSISSQVWENARLALTSN